MTESINFFEIKGKIKELKKEKDKCILTIHSENGITEKISTSANSYAFLSTLVNKDIFVKGRIDNLVFPFLIAEEIEKI